MPGEITQACLIPHPLRAVLEGQVGGLQLTGPGDLYQTATGTHPSDAPFGDKESARARRSCFSRAQVLPFKGRALFKALPVPARPSRDARSCKQPSTVERSGIISLREVARCTDATTCTIRFESPLIAAHALFFFSVFSLSLSPFKSATPLSLRAYPLLYLCR